MIFIRTKYLFYLLFFVIAGGFSSCKDVWDEHTELTDASMSGDLYIKIQANSDLSKFSEMLKATGYDKIISSSKSYTVWAPSNNAIANLDQSILTDTARLRKFVAFHISNQSYTTTAPADTVMRVLTLGGKYADFSTSLYNDGNIVSSNLLGKNGVLHIIDKASEPLLSIWEYVKQNSSQFKQAKFLTSLDTSVFDATKAKQTGVDPTTGEPIYETGTGYVKINKFLTYIADVSKEDGKFTFFILDDGYDTEYNKVSKYFYTESTNPDSTTSYLTQVNVVKDLVVKGIYTKEQLPDTLLSAYNVRIPINKSAIKSSYRLSNGIVHVIGSINFKVEDKIPSFKIEGEIPYSFSASRTSNIYYRTKADPNSGIIYKDIEAYGTGVSLYNIQYRVYGVRSVKYKVYWRAIVGALGDTQTGTISQRLSIGTAAAGTFPYTTVALRDYSEVYLGEYTPAKYGTLNLFMVSAASTTTGANTISLDYLKFVPVLN